MLAQAGRGKVYKEKYADIESEKSSKEKYNLYGFVWALQYVVHEELEPFDIELTQSYYEGLMDVPDLFPQGAAIPGSKGTIVEGLMMQIFQRTFLVVPGQDITALGSMHLVPPPSLQDISAQDFTHPSPPPPPPLETALMRLEQKLMDVDAQLLAFINESREIDRRID
ncbi:hypothetical protein ACOSQ4_027037 [Xanthoceras sorbifolium]